MRKHLQVRSTASLVVSMVALVVALSGGAYAASALHTTHGARAHSAAVSDKTSDKSIAKKAAKAYFNAHIGAASVASAGNANKLGGQSPAAYLDRAAQRDNSSGVALSDTTATDITPGSDLTIDVPSGVHFVEASGYATGYNANTTEDWILWITNDSTCGSFSGAGWANVQYGQLDVGVNGEELSQDLIFPESPGTHTFRLCTLESGGTANIIHPVLLVHTIASGPTGGSTLSATSDTAAVGAVNLRTAAVAKDH